MIEATKENPAPLDAFDSAKPDEPIWTVQGGDPLGGALLRVWVIFARIRAGIVTMNATNFVFEQLLKNANLFHPETEDEIDDLLVRCAQTEEISWSMDEYRAGNFIKEQAKIKATTTDRLDVYDVRRRCAGRISEFFSELAEFRTDLINLNWLTPEIDGQFRETVRQAQILFKEIEVGRKE